MFVVGDRGDRFKKLCCTGVSGLRFLRRILRHLTPYLTPSYAGGWLAMIHGRHPSIWHIHPCGTSIHLAHASMWPSHPCGPSIHMPHGWMAHMDGCNAWMDELQGRAQAGSYADLTPILTPSYAILRQPPKNHNRKPRNQKHRPKSKGGGFLESINWLLY